MSPQMPKFLFIFVLMLLPLLASAQMPNPYGANINLETAKKVAAPALAEARKNNWIMVVAIVDTAGDLVYYEKMDHTQLGSAKVAIAKSRSATFVQTPN